MANLDGVVVTAVDTGIGKTVICGGLLKLLLGSKKVAYWKPIQTGTIIGDDTEETKKLTDLSDDYFLAPEYRFAEPLSPYMAAKKWGKRIELDALHGRVTAAAAKHDFLVIEGAGGILVPLNEKDLLIDLMKRLKFPVIVVAEDRVGAINQTLLTLDRLRKDGVAIHGVILTRTRGTFGNSECISHFGQVEILAEIAPSDNQRSIVAQVACNERLRKLFHVPLLPV